METSRVEEKVPALPGPKTTTIDSVSPTASAADGGGPSKSKGPIPMPAIPIAVTAHAPVPTLLTSVADRSACPGATTPKSMLLLLNETTQPAALIASASTTSSTEGESRSLLMTDNVVSCIAAAVALKTTSTSMLCPLLKLNGGVSTWPLRFSSTLSSVLVPAANATPLINSGTLPTFVQLEKRTDWLPTPTTPRSIRLGAQKMSGPPPLPLTWIVLVDSAGFGFTTDTARVAVSLPGSTGQYSTSKTRLWPAATSSGSVAAVDSANSGDDPPANEPPTTVAA